MEEDYIETSEYITKMEQTLKAQGFSPIHVYHENDAQSLSDHNRLIDQLTSDGADYRTTKTQGEVKLWVWQVLKK